jgi:hypothetical protein
LEYLGALRGGHIPCRVWRSGKRPSLLLRYGCRTEQTPKTPSSTAHSYQLNLPSQTKTRRCIFSGLHTAGMVVFVTINSTACEFVSMHRALRVVKSDLCMQWTRVELLAVGTQGCKSGALVTIAGCFNNLVCCGINNFPVLCSQTVFMTGPVVPASQ